MIARVRQLHLKFDVAQLSVAEEDTKSDQVCIFEIFH